MQYSTILFSYSSISLEVGDKTIRTWYHNAHFRSRTPDNGSVAVGYWSPFSLELPNLHFQDTAVPPWRGLDGVHLWKLAQTLPSGYVKIAIENGHRNSGFSHVKWWIFPVRYVKLPEGTVWKIT